MNRLRLASAAILTAGITAAGFASVLALAATRIVLELPPGAAGTVQVTVTVGGVSSQATPAGLFTYLRLPRLPGRG